MKNNTVTIEDINRLRHSYYESDNEARRVVESLLDNNIIVNDSNDFMMAQYALISGYLWGQGKTDEGKYYIGKAIEFSAYATDKVSLIDVYIQAGNYATLDINYNESITWYFKALDLSEAMGYKRSG